MTSESMTSLRLPSATPPVSLPHSIPGEPRIDAARDLLAALRGEIELHPKPLRAGRLHFESGRLLESPLGEIKEAAEAYAKAHALLGDHLPSIRGARRTLLALGRPQEAVLLFDAELKLTAEPDTKAQLLYDKASVLEDLLGQRKEAREALESAAELGRGDATRIKSIERAEALAHSWEGLGRAFELEANAVKDDPRHKGAIVAARARLLEAHRGDPATAIELYQRAVDVDPQSSSALHALKRLHYGHQRWRDLIAILEREAELAVDPSVRAFCHYRVGRIWLDRLGSVEEAVRAQEKAAEQAGDDPMILEELARVYELSKQPEELASVLERLAAKAYSASDRLACYLRIAELYETRLNDESKAVTWYEKTRAVDRCYLPALQALSSLYTEKREFAKLLEVHAGEAEDAPDPARRAAAHARIAEIYEEHLGKPDLAMQHHSRALGVLPGYSASFKALVRLLTQARKYPEIVELYERAVDQAQDPETQVTYLYKIGRLYEDALGSPAQALVAYRRILEIAPQEVSAIHSVQRSAERAGLFKELIEALELEAERTPDRRRKLELFHRAGEVAESDLKDDALAVSLFQRLVEIDKTYAPAYASLSRLYYKAGRWEELLETYKSELRLLGKGPTLSALLFKMGQIYEERIGRDEDAIAAYRRAVEADPAHRAVVRALERKLEQKGVWDELVRVQEAELGTLEDPKLKARTALRIGEVYENRLRAPDKALLAYEQAILADPELGPARDGKIRLLTEARDYKRLVEELEREASAQKDVRLAIASLLRAGEVYRDDLGDANRALRAFEAVIERDPAQMEALLALEVLYADRGAWDALANVYASEARILSDVSARVGALRELGRLQQSGKVDSPDHGRQSFGAILELMPEDVGALTALERIALLESDAQLLAHVDAKLASVLSDPISIAAHETRLGELLEAAGDPQALAVYRAAIGRDPESIGAARGLSRIAERLGDPGLLAEAAEREARVLIDVGRAASGLLQAAERLIQVGDIERAALALARAIEIDPDHERTAVRLGEVLVGRGEVDRLISLLTRAAGAAQKPARVAGLWANVADLHANRKNDLPAGLAALQRAQNLVPGHVPTLLKLAEIYARDGQWNEAIERLKQALGERGASQDEKLEANLRLAAILDEHVGDVQGALTHLEAVLAIDSDHRAALERYASIQATRGALDEAADTAQRLVRVSPEVNARVRALTLLGRIERQRGQFEASAHAYEQAVAVTGVEGTAAEEFREMVATPRPGEAHPSFSRYLGALIRYADGAATATPGVFLEIARTLFDRMNQPEQAFGWLERGLQRHSLDVPLRLEFGERLLQAGQHQRAFGEFMRVVELDVQREAAWRKLAEALSGIHRAADGTLALAPLVAFGFANDLELAKWSMRVPRTAGAVPGSFRESELSVISAHPGDDPAAQLIRALADIVPKLFAPELERWGVSSRDRVSGRSGHPIRSLADRIAAIFGVEDFELYLHRAHSGLVEVELTDPVSLLVPTYVTGLKEPEQAFLLGRALASAARGLAAVERLTPPMLGALLSAGARLVDPNFSAREHDEEYLSSLARRLARSLPWLGRGPIEDAAREYAEAPIKDVSEWAFQVKLTAARAASIVADDLPSSVGLVRRLEGDLSGAEGPSVAQGMRVVHDLARFWVSEPSFVLRRRLGLG